MRNMTETLLRVSDMAVAGNAYATDTSPHILCVKSANAKER
jgi:hypothetical protein